jgi:hypothetical protein
VVTRPFLGRKLCGKGVWSRSANVPFWFAMGGGVAPDRRAVVD